MIQEIKGKYISHEASDPLQYFEHRKLRTSILSTDNQTKVEQDPCINKICTPVKSDYVRLDSRGRKPCDDL